MEVAEALDLIEEGAVVLHLRIEGKAATEEEERPPLSEGVRIDRKIKKRQVWFIKPKL